jgi:hypothetical protein
MGQIDAVVKRRRKVATNCSHHELHTVKVLNLTTGTWNITLAVHGYIDIASEGALWVEKYEFFFGRKDDVAYLFHVPIT